jgi:hypothetical protein
MKPSLSSAFVALLVLAAAGYVLQCFTPMRLEEDVVVYLTTASAALRGQGFTYEGQSPPFPPGYPAVVWLMASVGLGTSVFLNLLNGLAGAGGLLAAVSIARSRGLPSGASMCAIAACALSFGMVKGAAIQLSDIVCFGFTLCAVALAESARRTQAGRAAWLRWAASLALAGVAFSMRMAGIAILAAVLFEACKAAVRAAGTARVVAGVAVAIAVVGTAISLFTFFHERSPTGGGYLKSLTEYANRSPAAIIGDHLLELGEMSMNIPRSKLPAAFAGLFTLAGLLNFSTIALLLFRARRRWTPGRTFLVFYMVMIFAYPRYCELRVWLPTIPLFALEIVSALNSAGWDLTAFDPVRSGSSRRLRMAVAGYSLYFLSTGFVALGYSVWLSFSQPAFLSAPINRFYRAEYEVWLTNRPESPGLDPRILPVLRQFGKHL